MSILLTTFLLACAPKHTEPEGGRLGVIGGYGAVETVEIRAVGVDPAYTGLWQGDDSTAVYRFLVNGDTLLMQAWNSDGGESFHLENLRYDGTIHVRTTMPSTNWTLENEYILQEDGSIRSPYSGAVSGESLLRKIKE
jgi:hypothetical protein